ncbi:hypothetical protein JB92DRAFT_3005207 [Gautieria morchelliformis]|nr:hypothetical protein JB92DRAFT_3005207 [Gautieria morchelliformis]
MLRISIKPCMLSSIVWLCSFLVVAIQQLGLYLHTIIMVTLTVDREIPCDGKMTPPGPTLPAKTVIYNCLSHCELRKSSSANRQDYL